MAGPRTYSLSTYKIFICILLVHVFWTETVFAARKQCYRCKKDACKELTPAKIQNCPEIKGKEIEMVCAQTLDDKMEVKSMDCLDIIVGVDKIGCKPYQKTQTECTCDSEDLCNGKVNLSTGKPLNNGA